MLSHLCISGIKLRYYLFSKLMALLADILFRIFAFMCMSELGFRFYCTNLAFFGIMVALASQNKCFVS